MPPPRPAERLWALRCEAKAESVRLQRCVRMSRIIAAREKTSAGIWAVEGVEDHVFWRGWVWVRVVEGEVDIAMDGGGEDG